MPEYKSQEAEYQNIIQDKRLSNLEEDFKTLCSNYNHEIGEVRDKIASVDQKVEKITTDVEWLKRSYWVVATASIGALITAMINFLTRIGKL